MRDEAGLEIALLAHGAGRTAGDVQILRDDKFDTFDQYVTTGRIAVCGNCQRFHAALVLFAVFIHLGQDRRQCDPLPGADIFDGDIHLDNTALRFQTGVAQVHLHGIGAPDCRQVHRDRTFFRIDDNAAVHRNRRVREGDDIPLRVGIGDELVNQLRAGCLANMLDEEFQDGAFAGRDAQLRNRPPERLRSYCRR